MKPTKRPLRISDYATRAGHGYQSVNYFEMGQEAINECDREIELRRLELMNDSPQVKGRTVTPQSSRAINGDGSLSDTHARETYELWSKNERR